MSFNTSLSGINAANADLNATANNIANVNTTGFKESRAEFADLFSYTTYGLSRNAIGAGVKVSNVAQQFSQGNIDPTGRSLDFAIDGEGFFTVNKNGNTLYTRAGNFQTDNQGYVVTPDGARLQVFAPNASGNGFDVGRLSDLQLLTTDSAPRQTGNINLMVTLPGNASSPIVAPFDPADPNSYNASSGGVTVYDSLGVAHVQTSYFVKTGNPNEWQVYNYVDGEPVNAGSVPADASTSPPTAAVTGTPATLQFSSNGALLSISTITPGSATLGTGSLTPTAANDGFDAFDLTVNGTTVTVAAVPGTNDPAAARAALAANIAAAINGVAPGLATRNGTDVTFNNSGSAAVSIVDADGVLGGDINVAAATASGGDTPTTGRIADLRAYTPATGAGTLDLTLNLSGSTQYGASFALRDVRQDGYPSGKLSEINVSEEGVVYARYSNGDDRALGQIALTRFVNPQGLQSQGNNMWGASYAAGTPRTGAPDSSDFGQVQSGALESSTVDLTEQLVNMIVAQRNFQANAQMISTQDQATQTVLNIR